MTQIVSTLWAFTLLGGVGAIAGAAAGYVVGRWLYLLPLIVLGFVVALHVLARSPDDLGGLFIVIAAVGNAFGWTVGLVVGAIVRRLRVRSRQAAA